MLLAGNDIPIHRGGDIIHSEHEVIGLQDMVWPLDPIRVPKQRDDVERAGLLDRVVKRCKRADMNHCYLGVVVDQGYGRG
jgi:hypothetical protein